MPVALAFNVAIAPAKTLSLDGSRVITGALHPGGVVGFGEGGCPSSTTESDFRVVLRPPTAASTKRKVSAEADEFFGMWTTMRANPVAHGRVLERRTFAEANRHDVAPETTARKCTVPPAAVRRAGVAENRAIRRCWILPGDLMNPTIRFVSMTRPEYRADAIPFMPDGEPRTVSVGITSAIPTITVIPARVAARGAEFTRRTLRDESGWHLPRIRHSTVSRDCTSSGGLCQLVAPHQTA